MRPGRAPWLKTAGLAACLLALPVLAWACPTCKDAFTENPEGQGFAKGVYLSIVVFFTVFFGMVGFFIYQLVQAAKREQDPPAPLSSPPA